MATLTINPAGLRAIAERHGLTNTTELAQLIGVHQSNVSRALAAGNGPSKPSNKFIAGIAAAFGYTAFPAVFTVEEDDQ